MQSFMLPPNGQATPSSIARKRKMAEQLMGSMGDTSPVGSWTQGLARVLQAGVGGYVANKADSQEAAGRQGANVALIKALQGKDSNGTLEAMQDPWLNEGQQGMLADQWKQLNDPNREIDMQLKKAQLSKLQRPDLQMFGEHDSAYDPSTKTWVTPPVPEGGASSGLFDSKSVEGQALNYLIQTQKITPDQAAQIGAGKPITGADGSMHFLTPQDIVQAAQQAQTSLNGQPNVPAQAGIPLGPPKKTESEIKGEAIQSGIGSSVATIMDGGTPDKPFPILDELASLQNSAGANVPGGRMIMTGKAQKGFDALKNIAQNYIYALSGQQAPEQEVMRAMSSVMPSPIDGPEAIAGKQARLMDMIKTIDSRAQGPGGQPSQQVTPPPTGQAPPSAPPSNSNDPLSIR